jgi:hypothetical protein
MLSTDAFKLSRALEGRSSRNSHTTAPGPCRRREEVQVKCPEAAHGHRQDLADAGYSVRRVRRHIADVQERILTGRFSASSSERGPSGVGH